MPWAELREGRLERWVRVEPWRLVERPEHVSPLLNPRVNLITAVQLGDLEVNWLQDIDPDRYPGTTLLRLRRNPEAVVTSPLCKRHALE